MLYTHPIAIGSTLVLKLARMCLGEIWCGVALSMVFWAQDVQSTRHSVLPTFIPYSQYCAVVDMSKEPIVGINSPASPLINAHPSVHPSICPSICPSIRPSIPLSAHPLFFFCTHVRLCFHEKTTVKLTRPTVLSLPGMRDLESRYSVVVVLSEVS